MTPRLQLSTGGWEGMYLPLDDFQGKVLESAPELGQLLPRLEPDDCAKVNQSDVASGIQHNVLRLQVSVQDAHLMAVAHGIHDLPEQSLGLLFLHAPRQNEVMYQFSTCMFHHNVDIFTAFSNLKELDHICMVQGHHHVYFRAVHRVPLSLWQDVHHHYCPTAEMVG
ncbi:hypothetical protein H1C71_014460 [Ictidomys tridecemlineatus]|nr:hypothetical protein H1C71_014460 [Ictidomys tridecemlineatus]